MERAYKKHLVFSVFLIVLMTLFGVAGYVFLEHYPLLDALYMTVITVGTVGYGEVHSLTPIGKIFTIGLIISSLGIFAYAITSITTYLIEVQLKFFILGQTRMKEIKKMKDHIIVCGYGRLGKQVAAELKHYKIPFLIVEKDKHIITASGEQGYLFLEGDATEDEILIAAGIRNAKGIVATMPVDADNLYLILSAKTLNPELTLISRASSDSSDIKLRKAGAHHVVLPEKVGGSHMASLIAKPDVLEFYNHLSVQGDEGVNLIEVVCSDLPEELINKTIHDLSIRRVSGANIVGYKSPDGKFIVNPPPETLMSRDAKLFVLGTPEQIKKMKAIIRLKS
ncbi:MAG: TrkA family potassium uptake protein [Bacteroidales bacterium]